MADMKHRIGYILFMTMGLPGVFLDFGKRRFCQHRHVQSLEDLRKAVNISDKIIHIDKRTVWDAWTCIGET